MPIHIAIRVGMHMGMWVYMHTTANGNLRIHIVIAIDIRKCTCIVIMKYLQICSKLKVVQYIAGHEAISSKA